MLFTSSSLALIGALGFASAAPTSSLTSRGEGTTFNLLYSNNGDATIPDSVAALRTGIWSVGSRNNQAVLLPNRSDGSLFYQYGSEPSIGFASVSLVITPGGTATVPSSFPVEFVPNKGTSVVEILMNDSGIPTLHYNGGRFQACAHDDEIVLSYIAPGQRQFADCAPVELISACSGAGVGSQMVGQLGKPDVVSCQSN